MAMSLYSRDGIWDAGDFKNGMDIIQFGRPLIQFYWSDKSALEKILSSG